MITVRAICQSTNDQFSLVLDMDEAEFINGCKEINNGKRVKEAFPNLDGEDRRKLSQLFEPDRVYED